MYYKKLKNKAPSDHPKVSIIVLNWNGKEDTLKCLESVLQIDYPNFELITVDNGSSDGSANAIRLRFPEVIVLETGTNLGYAGGNNLGIRYARRNGADWILLLNNDIIVDAQLLREFFSALTLVPKGRIFSGKIYYFSQPNMIWYAGGKRINRQANFKHVGQLSIDNGQDFSSIVETDYASGCVFFVNTDVFNKIGLFDEKLYLTYEETDFCYRARRAGFKSYFVPNAKVWHKVSISFGGEGSAVFNYFITRNKLLWAENNLDFVKRIEVYISLTYEFLKYYLLPPRFYLKFDGNKSLAKTIYRSIIDYKVCCIEKYKDPKNKAYRWGLRDYFLRRFGDCPDSVRSLIK